MPIKLLRNIKLNRFTFSKSQEGKGVLRQQFSGKHVLGAYVFPCKDLKSNQPLFNDGFPSLIFMPRSTDHVRLRRKKEIVHLKSAWACCGVIQDTHWEIPEGLEYILVLRFNPSSFYSLFKIDPMVFRSAPVCSFQDLVSEGWSSVINQMYQKEGVSEKISFLESVLSEQNTDDYLPYFLQAAIDHIELRKGNTTVSDVLKALGEKVNHKWLQRNFVKYLGISPKKYISLQRFIYAYGRYGENKNPDLLDTALHSGYYDHSHFYKDFKQYIGITPSQYAWD